MHAIIEHNLEAIQAICQEMDIEKLYLIGSAAREKDFAENSDFDFLFQFKKKGSTLLRYDYFDLLFSLENITHSKVDLIAIEKITNKYFLERVNKEKIMLYEC